MKRKFSGSLERVDALKVLHLIDSEGVYGAEMVLLALVKAQADRGVESIILSAGEESQGEKPLEKEAKCRGLPVVAWRMRQGFNLGGLKAIVDFAIKSHVDVLHSHGYKFNVLLSLLPKKRRKLPWVVTLHGYLQHPFPTKGWLYNTLDRLLVTRADILVAVSDTITDRLICGRAKRKIYVIPNGVELPSQQNKLPLDEDLEGFYENYDKVFIAVGRLSKEKGFDVLITAMAPILSSDNKIGLLILGDGLEKKTLQSIVGQHQLNDQVLFAGYRSSASCYIERAHALIISSRTEGLPITLLEAMASRVPVVATKVGGMPKVLKYGELGLLVEAENPVNLQEAIGLVLENYNEAKERAKEAKEEIAKHYSMSAIANLYIEKYKKIL